MKLPAPPGCQQGFSRPRRPYPFPSLFGGQPPNPRSSNAGEAKYFAARADTFSPSGV